MTNNFLDQWLEPDVKVNFNVKDYVIKCSGYSEPFLYGSRSKQVYDEFDNKPIHFHTETSDWDFALPAAVGIYEKLLGNGFTRKEDMDYQDNTTMWVLNKEIYDVKIQISLREKFAAFKAAWRSIDPNFYGKYINKRSPTAMSRDEVVVYLNSLVDLHEGIYSDKPKNLGWASSNIATNSSWIKSVLFS